MLGLRLDADLARRLDSFAAEARRTRSDVARDAVREYLDRRAGDAELMRELRLIAAATTEEELAELDAIHADLMAAEPPYDQSDRTS